MRFKSRTRAMAVAALAASVSLAGLTTVAPAGAAPAETDRIAGTTRYGTAAEVATRAFPTGADTVVVTTGEKIPDALSANPIAGENDAPILLVQQNAVPAETQAAMTELDPSNVIIVGGSEAVSNAVEAAIEAQGATVTREAGTDRFETAAEVARAVGEAPAIDADGAGSQTAMPTVALANGLTGLADAVSASPMLHQEEIPLLLTSGNSLNEDAAAAIDELGATQVLVLGGTAVIPASVIDELEEMGLNVEVLAGGTRFETATAIADFEVDFLGFDAARTFLASGFSLVDALAGGPVASVENGPIVLVTETDVPAGTAAWLEENAADIDEVVAIGGTAVINDSVLTEAAALADEAAGPTGSGVTTRPELVSAAVVSTDPVLGTSVRFTFDEAVTGAAPDLSDFFVFDGSRNVYSADRAVADTTDTSSIIARFPVVNTASEVASLTLATVQATAVTDVTGQTNPIGDAPLTPTGSALTAGTTSAPDLVSVGNVRLNGANTLVDFTFDEAVATTTATSFGIVRTNGTADSAESVAAGANSTTITVQFDGVTLSASDISRGFVLASAVADAGNDQNPLQAAELTNSGNSLSPDLVSVEYRPDTRDAATSTDIDQVLYTFDESVVVTTGTNFNVYLADSSEVSSQAVGATAAAVRSTTNTTQVLVTFPDGTLSSAVGASVEAGAVAGTTGTAQPNRPDEVAQVGTGVSLTAGRTIAPDLITAVRTPLTDPFGTPTNTAISYVFDEDIDAADYTEANFMVYLADGTAISNPTSCTRGTTEDTDSTVTCVFGTNAGNAVLATVARNSVTEDVGDLQNPEGAAVVTAAS